MGVLIAHPHGGAFVRATVEALDQARLLQRFATTLADDPRSVVQSLARRAWPGLAALLARRPLPLVERHRIATAPGAEVFRSLVQRMTGDDVTTDRAWSWMIRRFDAWAATLVDADTRAVYGFEHGALSLFEAAARRGLPRILEVTAAEPDGVRRLVAREAALCGAPPTRYERHVSRLHASRLAWLRREFSLATCVVANSRHTLDSYRRAGLRTDHFVVVPLGAPEPCAHHGDGASGPVRLVWAGSFSLNKGARVLVEALRGGSPEGLAPIDAFGSVSVPDALREQCARHVRFHGQVAQDRLFKSFGEADALLLPSLSDGWGMVVGEALAHGLPVITTGAVGAATLVVHGENGLVLPAGDAAALRAALEWAACDPARLRSMRARAAASAPRTWVDYRRDIAGAVRAHIGHG